MCYLGTDLPGAGAVRPPFDIDTWDRFIRGEVERTIHRQRLPRALYDDIKAQAFLGLAEALARCDPTQREDFRGFARLRVRGAIIDGIRTLGRLSRRGYEAARRLSEGSALSTADVVEDLVTEAALGILSSTATCEEEYLSRERQALLIAALAELCPEDRALIDALYGMSQEPKSGAELAAVRGTGRSAVSHRHRRILHRLRRSMEAAHG